MFLVRFCVHDTDSPKSTGLLSCRPPLCGLCLVSMAVFRPGVLGAGVSSRKAQPATGREVCGSLSRFLNSPRKGLAGLWKSTVRWGRDLHTSLSFLSCHPVAVVSPAPSRLRLSQCLSTSDLLTAFLSCWSVVFHHKEALFLLFTLSSFTSAWTHFMQISQLVSLLRWSRVWPAPGPSTHIPCSHVFSPGGGPCPGSPWS